MLVSAPDHIDSLLLMGLAVTVLIPALSCTEQDASNFLLPSTTLFPAQP